MPTVRALERLVVALDFSTHGSRVLERVALLPLSRRAIVTLLHVRPPLPPLLRHDGLARAALHELQRAADTLRPRLGAAATVATVVARGAPARALARRARALDAELVVLGRRGGGGLRRLALGSTAAGVAAADVAPVLVVGPTPAAVYRRPLAAVDFSAVTDAVLHAVSRVTGGAARITLLHAVSPYWQDVLVAAGTPRRSIDRYRRDALETARRELARVGLRAERLGVQVQRLCEEGDPRAAIPAVAARQGADLVALGTRGHGRAARRLLGSVAAAVADAAPCDVLVVPPRRPA